jgi:uncharacterized membrane-anchored protein
MSGAANDSGSTPNRSVHRRAAVASEAVTRPIHTAAGHDDTHARAGALVLVRRHHLSEHREHATSGSILLDGDYVLSKLGTALGDWVADTGRLGYEGGALVFAAGLAVTAALYYWTDVSRVLLFWAAFILTRPLGATLGDFLDKPLDHGGLALSRPIASAVIAAIMIGLIIALPQRPGSHPRGPRVANA